jgi:hypothetical protein
MAKQRRAGEALGCDGATTGIISLLKITALDSGIVLDDRPNGGSHACVVGNRGRRFSDFAPGIGICRRLWRVLPEAVRHCKFQDQMPGRLRSNLLGKAKEVTLLSRCLAHRRSGESLGALLRVFAN